MLACDGPLQGTERAQSTVEWVGLLLLVSLLVLALVAGGVRIPGAALARAIASRLLCAVSFAQSCGDEPALIAAYGTELGELARRHMPSIAFEKGSRALPVDFRRCRTPACGDGAEEGAVLRSESGEPVTAFVHVIDCRPGRVAAVRPPTADCSGSRRGNIYLEYWTYYADSATMRGLPVVGGKGYHHDDWEGVEIRIGPDGDVDERATSHRGFNYARGIANWASDAGFGPLKKLAELTGARARNGWGPETRWLFVSGGSHAGNVKANRDFGRFTPGRRVRLVPLEPIAGSTYGFAIDPPWRKRVWLDPEAEGTG